MQEQKLSNFDADALQIVHGTNYIARNTNECSIQTLKKVPDNREI